MGGKRDRLPTAGVLQDLTLQEGSSNGKRMRSDAKEMKRRCKCGAAANPSFGLPGGTRKDTRWCAKCPSKPLAAVYLGVKTCDCGRTIPSLGLPGGTRRDAKWCSKCPSKPPGAVNLVNKRCECGSATASFGQPGGLKRDLRWCSRCPSKPKNALRPKGSVKKLNPKESVPPERSALTHCECGSQWEKPPAGTKVDVMWCLNCPNMHWL